VHDNSADAYRRLAAALDEMELWRRLAPLLPYAVHYDHRAARIASRIPTQRPPTGRLIRRLPPYTPLQPLRSTDGRP